MSKITRCPACATTFRVSESQLRARAGQVRCGRCGALFDALAALSPGPSGRVGLPEADAPPASTAPMLDTEGDAAFDFGPRPHRRSSRLWWLGSAFLVLALAGQGAYRGGWTLSGLGLFRSGRPYTMTWGDDRNGTTQNDARPGNRNTVRGDAFGSVDLAATKRVDWSRHSMELRAEVFNVLSTTNYDEYVGSLSSPAFGSPISAFPRRRVQLAAIVRF